MSTPLRAEAAHRQDDLCRAVVSVLGKRVSTVRPTIMRMMLLVADVSATVPSPTRLPVAQDRHAVGDAARLLQAVRDEDDRDARAP